MAVPALDFSLIGSGDVQFNDVGSVPPEPILAARFWQGDTVEKRLAFGIRRQESGFSLVYQSIAEPAVAPRYLAAVSAGAAGTRAR